VAELRRAAPAGDKRPVRRCKPIASRRRPLITAASRAGGSRPQWLGKAADGPT